MFREFVIARSRRAKGKCQSPSWKSLILGSKDVFPIAIFSSPQIRIIKKRFRIAVAWMKLSNYILIRNDKLFPFRIFIAAGSVLPLHCVGLKKRQKKIMKTSPKIDSVIFNSQLYFRFNKSVLFLCPACAP